RVVSQTQTQIDRVRSGFVRVGADFHETPVAIETEGRGHVCERIAIEVAIAGEACFLSQPGKQCTAYTAPAIGWAHVQTFGLARVWAQRADSSGSDRFSIHAHEKQAAGWRRIFS